jgi:hypothetical protein
VEGGGVTLREFGEGCAGCGGYGVEYAEQRIAVAVVGQCACAVAGYQFGVIEVVTRVKIKGTGFDFV